MSDNSNSSDKNEIKIILLGDAGVGKTSIILRYYKNEFLSNNISTIGASYIQKEIKKDDIIYKLNIWDTSGQERYRAVTKLFVQGASIIILVYSINVKETFNILEFWYKSIIDICGGDDQIVLAVVGNKMDLFGEESEENIVPEELAKKFAKEKKAIFKTVSAKVDWKGISSLFEELLDELIKKNPGKNLGTKIIKIDNKKKKNKKKGFC